MLELHVYSLPNVLCMLRTCYMYVCEHINDMYDSPCASVTIVMQPRGHVLIPHITCMLY